MHPNAQRMTLNGESRLWKFPILMTCHSNSAQGVIMCSGPLFIFVPCSSWFCRCFLVFPFAVLSAPRVLFVQKHLPRTIVDLRYVADFDLSGPYIRSVHEWFGLRQALLDHGCHGCHGWSLKMFALCGYLVYRKWNKSSVRPVQIGCFSKELIQCFHTYPLVN